jgi:hypothetical protein
VATEDGWTTVTYWSTKVVQFNHWQVKLNTGGWRTATTKSRMNQASVQFGLGYQVYQHKGEWYVRTKADEYRLDGRVIVIDRETGQCIGQS